MEETSYRDCLPDLKVSLFFVIVTALLVTIYGLILSSPAHYFSSDVGNTTNQAKKLSVQSSIHFEAYSVDPAQPRFSYRGPAFSLLISATENTLKHSTADGVHTLKTRFLSANKEAEIVGGDTLESKSHYLLGTQRQDWREDVRHFSDVHVKRLYDRVDLRYHGENSVLEYDFIVHPGGSYHQIAMMFDTAADISLNEKGDLIITGASGEITQQAPIAYQEIAGKRIDIDSRYILEFSGKQSDEDTLSPHAVVSFELGSITP